ncbi:hypothetical protein LOTGIDRAFT_238026 [Lottia gigantea]|uniref:Codanin-1 C-terminal domain-containing protein n=1 Tax=Lottia gigantea TaxID=225164 RepID=V4CJA6_LOTGI|nr:hypothetical protein LOTGIDRAFT_238026 [Lottia gigantea]ESP02295.1 hypothetical protein LOTGIDRAFT_238026 [Lottia gigantea]
MAKDQFELFASCLLTLRLLGKFLGFLTFSPYHSVHGLPDDIQTNYIELRNNQPNPIDILELMVVSINTERLNITIPWIIEYLSMMDRIAPVLNYYHRVLYLLQYIHRLSWKSVKKDKYNYGCLMLVSMLGWLFESPIMPQGIFKMEEKDELQNIIAIDSTNCSLKPVDNLDLVSQELLYTVCPYLGEIRTLLLEFAVGANSKSTIRKITPVSADDLPEPETDRNLQTQLEENFFHNHPASMKRTVEFVSERTASNFIKHFRATDLPWSISEAKSRVNSLLQTLNSTVVSPTNKIKDQNHQLEYKKIAQNLCEEVKRKVSNTKREYCSSRVNSALKLLLPDEQSSAVTNMAASICCRLAEERIKSWITNHISTAMYLKEVNTEADKVFKKSLLEQSSNKQINIGNRLDLPVALLNTTTEASSSLTNVTTKSILSQAVLIPVCSVEDSHYKHREDVISLSDLLHTIQIMNKEMVVNRCSSPDYTRLMMVMEQTHHVLLFKEDTVPQAVRSLAQLILDLAISIISYMPELITVELLDCYKRLYETELKDVTIFSIVSSPRWFYLLYTSPNKQKCVPSYVLFMCLLLMENLITIDIFEKGCIKVLNSSNVYKELIKTIICDIIKYFNSNQQVTIKFSSDILTILQLNNNKHDLQTELSHLAIHPNMTQIMKGKI